MCSYGITLLLKKSMLQKLVSGWRIPVYWVVMLPHWVCGFHGFEGMVCLPLQVFRAC